MDGWTDLPMGSAWKSVRTCVAPSLAPVPRKSGTVRVVPSRRGSKGALFKSIGCLIGSVSEREASECGSSFAPFDATLISP